MAEKKKKAYEISELDQYLFGQGNHYEIYKKLGAHRVKKGKKEGVYFAVWAPHAKSVSVIGEFNEWDIEANPMERQESVGIFTCIVFRHIREIMCLRRIRLRTMQSSGRGRRLRLRISAI